MRRNELWDGVTDLDYKAITPSHVRDDPHIFAGRAVESTKDMPAEDIVTTDRDRPPLSEVIEHKGDLLIRDLW